MLAGFFSSCTHHLPLLSPPPPHSPIVTGDELFYRGHSDGAFSLPDHPPCAQQVNLPLRFDLFANSLNPGMNHKLLADFFKLGIETEEDE